MQQEKHEMKRAAAVINNDNTKHSAQEHAYAYFLTKKEKMASMNREKRRAYIETKFAKLLGALDDKKDFTHALQVAFERITLLPEDDNWSFGTYNSMALSNGAMLGIERKMMYQSEEHDGTSVSAMSVNGVPIFIEKSGNCTNIWSPEPVFFD